MGKYSLTQLRGILEEAVSESDPKPYKMAKWAYQACMDTEELEVSLSPKHFNPFIGALEWHPLFLFRYSEMAQCIIRQYNNFTIKELDNLPVNGILTQVT